VFEWIFDLYHFTFVNETDRTQMWQQWVEDIGVRPLQCRDGGGKLLTVKAVGCKKGLDKREQPVNLNVEMDICVGMRCPEPDGDGVVDYDYSRIIPMPEGCELTIPSSGVSLGGGGGVFGSMVVAAVAGFWWG